MILQIGAASFYYKLGQLFLKQIGASVIANWGNLIITNQGSYYKLGQPLLQIGVIITNWDITVRFKIIWFTCF